MKKIVHISIYINYIDAAVINYKILCFKKSLSGNDNELLHKTKTMTKLIKQQGIKYTFFATRKNTIIL